MWMIYTVRWDFITQLCGSVPADPEIVKIWIESMKPKVKPPGGKSLDEITEEVYDSIEKGELPTDKYNVLQFQRWEGMLVTRSATIKAHIKDCARVLSGMVGRLEGESAFSTKIINGVYPDETQYWIPILHQTDGSPFTEPTGARDKPVHARGPRGIISALKRFEFCVNARMEFRLKVLTPFAGRTKTKKDIEGNEILIKSTSKPSVTREDLIHLFEYGGVHGYGGERGDGEGKYIFTILKEERS